MTARQCCVALEGQLAEAGLSHLAVRYIPDDRGPANRVGPTPGFYVAPATAASWYGALGHGSDFPAHSMNRQQVTAYVAGLCAAKEASAR